MTNYIFSSRFAVALFMVGVFHSLTLAQSTNGNSWKQVNEKGEGTLRIIYFEQPRMIEKTRQGELKGVCVDLLKEFVLFAEKKYNKKVRLDYVQEEDGNRFYKVIDSDPFILGVGNISITKERIQKYNFTPPYMPNFLVMLSNNNAEAVRTLPELQEKFKGFTAIAISNSVSIKVLENIRKNNLPGLKIEVLPTRKDVFERLHKDPRSFTVLDFTESIVDQKYAIKKHSVELERTEDLGFVMSKRSDWKKLWDEFLTTDYKASSSYRKIVSTHLGSSFLATIDSRASR